MAISGTNTMAEGLNKVRHLLADMMGLPDADLDFVGKLDGLILAKLRQPIDAANQAMQQAQAPQGPTPPGPPGGGQMMGGPGGPPPGGPPSMAGGPSIGAPGPSMGNVPGMRPSGGPINPDELRRVIGGGAQ